MTFPSGLSVRLKQHLIDCAIAWASSPLAIAKTILKGRVAIAKGKEVAQKAASLTKVRS